MVQDIIVYAIVAAAVVYTVSRLLTFFRRRKGCGCGCGCGCGGCGTNAAKAKKEEK